ncbi:MAG TPA: hypothetical protein VGC41_07315 [Kofleriaceae bacterium]
MRRALFALVFSGAACGSSNHASDPPTDGSMQTGDGSGSGSGSGACPRSLGAEDRTRYLVVSHPYTTTGAKSTKFEVLSVSPTGAITRGKQFDMNRTSFGSIAFTPDGKVGIAVSSDSYTLGVFTLSDDGTPTVIDGAWGRQYFTPERVVIDPSGSIAYVLDSNTRGTNKGGIHAVQINCDGSLSYIGMIAEASTPRQMLIDGDRAFIAATTALDAPAGSDIEMLKLAGSGALTVMAGVDAFGDDDAIFGGMAITADKSAILIGDTSAGGQNRVATVKVTATAMTANNILPLPDPEAIETSPFDNTAIVTTADGDRISILEIVADGSWDVRGTLGSPQQPGDTVQVKRGALNGTVFISELSGIRTVTFGQAGAVTDKGLTDLTNGDDNDLVDLPGAIGITP